MTENPDTVIALAALLRVNRRRIAKWRGQGAPSSLDLIEWSQWLREQGKTKIADRITVATAPLGEPSPEEAAAEETDSAEDEDEIDGLKKPGDDAPAIEKERYWKVRRARTAALREEREDLIADRELIPFAEAKQLMHACAAAVLASIGDHIWLSLRPHLDGVPESLRQTIRRAHDEEILKVRERISLELRKYFRNLKNPPTTSA